MSLRAHLCVAAALLLAWALLTAAVALPATLARRHCFPRDFLFGVGVSGYDAGAVKTDTTTDATRAAYCREHPGDQCDGVARSFEHYFRQDVVDMARMQLQSFRFSASWSRIMSWDASSGRMQADLDGVAFYHSLLNELAGHYAKVIVVMSDGELPPPLQAQLGGWQHADAVEHFAQFSSLLFREFGGRVAFWTTFSDPLGTALAAQDGDPYVVGHHLLLAHARAVETFRSLQLGVSAAAQRAPVSPHARIGLALGRTHYYPLNPKNRTDVQATVRALDFDVSWFLDPLVVGDYPATMKRRVSTRLPAFTAEQKWRLRGSFDVLMLSHFQSRAVTDSGGSHTGHNATQWHTDRGVDDSHAIPGHTHQTNNTNSSGRCGHMTPYAPGYLAAIRWLHSKASQAPVLLTANGYCGDVSAEGAARQLEFFQQSLQQVRIAVTDFKIPVVGYTVWSLLDGYSDGQGFGLYAVDSARTSSTATDTRVARATVPWLTHVASTLCLPLNEVSSSSPSDDIGHDPGFWALVLLGVALTMVIGTLYVLLWRSMGRAVGRWAARRRGDATPEELSPLL